MAATPIPRIFAPVTITVGTNDKIAFRAYAAGGAGGLRSYTGTVAAATYTTAASLASAVSGAMQTGTRNGGVALLAGDGSYGLAVVNAAGNCVVSLTALSTASAYAIYWLSITARANGSYALGDLMRTTAGRIYICYTAGTSSSDPTAETDAATEGGTAVWSYRGTSTAYLGLATALGFSANDSGTSGSTPAWTAATLYEVGAIVTNDSGKVYYASVAGTSAGSGGPTGTGSPTDNTVTWEYVSAGELAQVTSDYTVPGIWSPGVPAESDSYRDLHAHVVVTQTAGGQTRYTRWTPSSPVGGRYETRRVRFNFLPPYKVWESEATGSYTNQSFEDFWLTAHVAKFKYSPDRSDPATDAADYCLSEKTCRDALRDVQRVAPSVELYDLELEMLEYNA